jgi:hypothetical protein
MVRRRRRVHQLAAGSTCSTLLTIRPLISRPIRAALGQAAHLAGHHRKAAALLAGAGRFHRRVQRQDVGLEGDAVDHADDVGDLARWRRLMSCIVATTWPTTSPPCAAAAGTGVASWLAWRALSAFWLHGGASAAPSTRPSAAGCAGLLLGALAQVGVAGGDLRRAGGDAVAAAAHL